MSRRNLYAIAVVNLMMFVIGCTPRVAPALNNALPTDLPTSAVAAALPPTWTATARPRPTATAIATHTPTPMAMSDTQNAASAIPADLEIFVAENVIHSDVSVQVDTSPNGAVVAHVVTYTLWSNMQPSASKVWRYSQGKFTDADSETLRVALGNTRADWPLYTFIFAFESISPDSAIANVYVFYNRGLSPESRGGFAAKWEFGKNSQGWTVLSHMPFMNWD